MDELNNTGQSNNIENKENTKEDIWSWIRWIVSAFLIAFFLRTFVFQMAIVNQISMQPTLKEGQMLVISKVNYLLSKPQRGDIVVFKDETENRLLIKRIIGLPGEELEIKNGRVYIDDEILEPDYTPASTNSYGDSAWQIPEDKYFVMGDNRPHSRDSRSDTVGFVDKSGLVGKAVIRIWPFNTLGIMR